MPLTAPTMYTTANTDPATGDIVSTVTVYEGA